MSSLQDYDRSKLLSFGQGQEGFKMMNQHYHAAHAAHVAHAAHAAHTNHAPLAHAANAAHPAHSAHLTHSTHSNHSNHSTHGAPVIQHHQSEQNMNQMNELQWHPSASAVPQRVFPVNDTLLWKDHSIQVDTGGTLQQLQAVPLHFRPVTTMDKTVAGTDLSLAMVQAQQDKLGQVTGADFSQQPPRKKIYNKPPKPSTPGTQKPKGVKKPKPPKQPGPRRKFPGLNKVFKKKPKVPPGTNGEGVMGVLPGTEGENGEGTDPVNPTVLEDDASQVQKRFMQGCECTDSNCFDGMSPEVVYGHRLNIAELTKEEHDMYLMGLTMATLSDWETTSRNKERKRLRAHYIHRGRPVCLQAFLYLENCTRYQMKHIRKHVLAHGVVARVHGNHGKRPHNTYPLDAVCHAFEFLKMFIKEKGIGHIKDVENKNVVIFLSSDVTQRSVHVSYQEHCTKDPPPNGKVMSFSTFRHILKDQFPHIRFTIPKDGRKRPKDKKKKKGRKKGGRKPKAPKLEQDENAAEGEGGGDGDGDGEGGEEGAPMEEDQDGDAAEGEAADDEEGGEDQDESQESQEDEEDSSMNQNAEETETSHDQAMEALSFAQVVMDGNQDSGRNDGM